MNKYLFIGFILLLISVPLLAQIDSSDSLHSPENRRKFADFLFCQKDYLRADSEYEELIGMGNNGLSNESVDTLRFKIALSFSNMGQFDEAFKRFKKLAYDHVMSEEARLELFKAKFFGNELSTLRNIYQGNIYYSRKYAEPIKSLYYTSFLLDTAALPDKYEFVKAFPGYALNEMEKFYQRKIDPPYKSPLKAALLSAIIPGLGKAYAGEWGDGITALIVTGLLSYISYDNLRAHHDFRGYTFGGLAALFYAGNVYGSAAQAQIYNAQVDFTFSADLKLYLNSHNYFLPVYETFCK